MKGRSDKRDEQKSLKKKGPQLCGAPDAFQISPGMLQHRNLIDAVLVFLSALFFIIAITSPALFINDEWITANQLHQLDIGHQVVINEAKYGATANGTISAYFTARGNVLLYSLALPVLSLPVVKIFSLFTDNFRLAVILVWSMIPALSAFLIEAVYPKYAKIRGIRLSIVGLVLGLGLFCINVLLYKQFPYSAPDAPYEVAALVITNHILFALIAAAVFESGRLIFRDRRLALFSVFACISCSSYIVWSGTAKDHILTSAVFALVIFFLVRYLYKSGWWDATAAFFFSGLLIWIRPEAGIVVSGLLFLVFIVNIFWEMKKCSLGKKQALVALSSITGAIAGIIPFFFNNLLLTGNFLTPVWVAPRPAIPILNTTQQVTQIVGSGAAAVTMPVSSLTPASTFIRLIQTRFLALTPDTFSQLAQVLTFPQNEGFGFFLVCPLVPVALIACIFWFSDIRKIQGNDRKVLLFLIVMTVAIFCSYIPEMTLLNTDAGTPPDMRYLIPAYISSGLLSLMILRRTPFFNEPEKILRQAFFGSIILLPAFIILMIILHPFGVRYEGYSAFFKFLVLAGILLCILCMVVSRSGSKISMNGTYLLPMILIALIISVLAFQVMLAFVVGDTIKFNGYPLWIPFIREGHGMIFRVSTLPAV